MWKSIIFVTVFWGLILIDNVKARPEGMEDLQAAAVMTFAAVKGAVDNGAAAKDNKEFEFLGGKIKNDMAIGFGDAMRNKRSTFDSSSDESDRRKRSASFETPRDLSKFLNGNEFADIIREKRSASEEYIPFDSSSLSLSIFSSSASSSSSSESEETERRKRNASFEILTNDIMNMYNGIDGTLKVKRSVGHEPSSISSEFDNLKRRKRSKDSELVANEDPAICPVAKTFLSFICN